MKVRMRSKRTWLRRARKDDKKRKRKLRMKSKKR